MHRVAMTSQTCSVLSNAHAGNTCYAVEVRGMQLPASPSEPFPIQDLIGKGPATTIRPKASPLWLGRWRVAVPAGEGRPCHRVP